mmetsp:Transcript_24702/g.53909  ORF Transcript_24702/g.53909 Transcript_24702/m.53909 type:complete len:317 (+) Transcript_24702:533-1483(+)
MMLSRSAWLGAWMETARVALTSCWARRTMALGTPTVEMVRKRAPIPICWFRSWQDLMTLGRFSSGSPMPMNTTLLTRLPNSSCTVITWSMISCGIRLRANPPLPVAQKVQRMGQPTCDDTHTVSRLRPSPSSSLLTGMPTHSTMRPSYSCSRNLCVPSGEETEWCRMERPVRTPSAISVARTSLGTVRISSMVLAPLSTPSCSCLPRYLGCPYLAASSASSSTDLPSSTTPFSSILLLLTAPVASFWATSTIATSTLFHCPSLTPGFRGTKVGYCSGSSDAAAGDEGGGAFMLATAATAAAAVALSSTRGALRSAC